MKNINNIQRRQLSTLEFQVAHLILTITLATDQNSEIRRHKMDTILENKLLKKR